VKQRAALRAVFVSCLAGAVACRPPSAPPPPPPPAPAPQVAAPQVLDAFSAADRAWIYAEGKQLRTAVLPELMQAVGALRADAQVAFAAMAAECGFQPVLSFEEMLVRLRWDPGQRKPAWSAVMRLVPPFDADVKCLRIFFPQAQETVLDRHPAWQLPRAFVAYDDGVFVVASDSLEAHATILRLMHPEPPMQGGRWTLPGVAFAANVLTPNPFGMSELTGRWTMQPPGSHLALHSRFTAITNARRAETIIRDTLLQTLGSSASLDPAIAGVASLFVQAATVNRDDAKLDLGFDMTPLSGNAGLVAKLTALSVRAVRLYNAWELMGDARDDVYFIARALADYVNRQRGLGRPARFPPSAPLIPDEIPDGKPVVPNPRAFAHPSWQDIGYSSDRPTFYACDFLTSKDGKSAVVQARGDIDGDGTTSLFELDVRLDAHGVPVIAPLIRERDPEE
jgi:hypothetical protein